MGKKSHLDEKRKVPGVLKQILIYDDYLTSRFYKLVSKFTGRSMRTYYKFLEFSCHGIPWIGGWLAIIWLLGNNGLVQMQINFFIGLIVDIIVLAFLKAATRRRRPADNEDDMFATVSVDKFSFPSGHATRAVYVAHFFSHAYPLHPVVSIPLTFWAGAVCLSRILLRRHHILDVLAGIVVGVLESYFIQWIWLSQEACVALLSWISEV